MSACRAPYGLNCSDTSASPSSSILWLCVASSDHDCSDVADADISGIATLIAFFTTAVSTFLVAWTLYIFDQHDKPSHLLHGAKRQPEHILDTRFRAWLHFSVFRRKTHLQLSDRSIHLLQRLLIAFSDGHLITGLAMLVAAFSQTQSITIFHFNVAVYLAWLSSSVHMVTLSVCRSYLQSSPFLVYWRLGAAGILWLLLLVSLAMTASPRSPVNRGDGEDDLDQAPFFWYDTPVLCTWHCSEMSKWPVDTIVASVLIALGFLSRAVKLIKPLSEQFGRVVVHQTSDIVKKTFTECAVKRIHVKSRLQKNGWSLCMWLTLILYLNLRALFDLFGSLLGELFWISLLLAWGTSKLVLLHLRSPLAENDWGFGQVLPLLLLLAPFAAIPELYLAYGKSQDRRYAAIAPASPRLGPRLPATTVPLDLQSEYSPIMATSNSSSSIQPPLPTLLTDRNEAYKSLSYRFLVVSYMSAGLIWLVLIVGYSISADDSNALKTLLSAPIYVGMILTPTFLGPAVFYTTFLTPCSRVIRRAMRESLRHSKLVPP